MADTETFDAAYVKQLREEAAQWRNKVRELEASGEVQAELTRRNVEADPAWVQKKPGQSVEDAVSDLINKHPNLSSTAGRPTSPVTPVIDKVVVPKVMPPGAKHTEVPTNPMHDRSIDEVKKDPVARSQLRDLYRGLLAQSSNQPDHRY